jgi:hypothetical protein
MNTKVPLSSVAENEFGQRVAARLSAGNQALPHDIGERLRVARAQAVAQRKQAPQLRAAPAVVQAGNTAALGGGGGWGWWTRIGTVVPLVALVAGLVTISVMQDERAGRGRFRAAHRRPAAGGLHRPGLRAVPQVRRRFRLTRASPALSAPRPASPLPSAA